MKVTLVWAKNDKDDLFTDGINDRGNKSDCNDCVMCPIAQVIVHHPNRDTTFDDHKRTQLTFLYNKNMYFRATVVDFKGI